MLSPEAGLIIEQVRNLSVEDLLAVRDTIEEELQYKQPSAAQTASTASSGHALIYRRTPEEIEAFLATIMSPEELAQVGKTEFNRKTIGPKSASQMLIEDREDRF